MQNSQTVLEEDQITDNLKLTTSVTFDKAKLYLNVDYMNGKFTVQKYFLNNYKGKEELQKEKNKISNESDVRKYLGLGE